MNSGKTYTLNMDGPIESSFSQQPKTFPEPIFPGDSAWPLGRFPTILVMG